MCSFLNKLVPTSECMQCYMTVITVFCIPNLKDTEHYLSIRAGILRNKYYMHLPLAGRLSGMLKRKGSVALRKFYFLYNLFHKIYNSGL
jgi:hypothetical protein